MSTTIQTSSVHLAMDGQTQLYVNGNKNGKPLSKAEFSNPTPNGAQAAQNLEQNMAEVKADSQQLQKMSEMVDGRKLQFNVNKDLGAVVVRVVDSTTNQVLKEIPSEDIQKLKIRIRQAIGSLYDNLA